MDCECFKFLVFGKDHFIYINFMVGSGTANNQKFSEDDIIGFPVWLPPNVPS